MSALFIFTAPHIALGCRVAFKTGTIPHDGTPRHRLTLWYDILHPTRLGNSVSRGTNLGFAFTWNVSRVTRTRVKLTLGTNHNMVFMEIAHAKSIRRIGKARRAN